jgi:hypothetical protein
MTRLLHLLHSTASGDLVFYIQPPSAFVFTPSVEKQDTCRELAETFGLGKGTGRSPARATRVLRARADAKYIEDLPRTAECPCGSKRQDGDHHSS